MRVVHTDTDFQTCEAATRANAVSSTAAALLLGHAQPATPWSRLSEQRGITTLQPEREVMHASTAAPPDSLHTQPMPLPPSDLRMSEHAHAALSELLCDMVPAPIFVLDGERRVVAASETLLALLGYEACDFVGCHIAEFLAEASIRFFKDVFWPSLADCGLAEDRGCELRTGKGALLRARLVGRPVLDGQAVRCVTCVVEDLTSHHFSEAKFSALFALSPVPMLVRRLEDGRILHANPALLSWAGYAAEALCGRQMDELAVFEPGPTRQRFERELRAGVPLRHASMRVKAADGTLLEVQAAAAAIQVCPPSSARGGRPGAAAGPGGGPQMLKAIEAVMSDTTWFSHQVVEKLASVRIPAKPSQRAGELADLTRREREVLAMISHGWADAEIAARLCLTRSTVRNHVAALYSKIDVHSRSSAIVWARERALNVIHPAAEFSQAPPRRPTPPAPAGVRTVPCRAVS